MAVCAPHIMAAQLEEAKAQTGKEKATLKDQEIGLVSFCFWCFFVGLFVFFFGWFGLIRLFVFGFVLCFWLSGCHHGGLTSPGATDLPLAP